MPNENDAASPLRKFSVMTIAKVYLTVDVDAKSFAEAEAVVSAMDDTALWDAAVAQGLPNNISAGSRRIQGIDDFSALDE